MLATPSFELLPERPIVACENGVVIRGFVRLNTGDLPQGGKLKGKESKKEKERKEALRAIWTSVVTRSMAGQKPFDHLSIAALQQLSALADFVPVLEARIIRNTLPKSRVFCKRCKD